MRNEARTGQERVLPGEMVIEQGGKPLAIPLLSARWSRKLAEGFPVSAARRHLEHEQLDRLRAVEPEITLDALWRWTDQKELVARRRGAGESVLPDQPLDAETLDVIPRRPGDVALPESVIKPVIDGLVQDYATKPGQARAMVELAAAIREWCCPKLRQPGAGPGCMAGLRHP